jgi:HD-like signal output (HDOD) protein/CheY-like chemotaxis protein
MRILFVDDEPRVLESLERYLFDSAQDWVIATATSGTQALDLLASDAFDVVVTDMRMPGMDGAQLLAYVHERWPSVTRIVLSGQTEQQSAMRALSSAHQFLSKPCHPRILTEVVENAYYLHALTPNARMREIAAAAHRVPSLPKIHQRILQLIDSPDASVRDAADLVAQDPGLCAKVLRVVNSAFFAGGHIVRDARTATARVGLDLLRSLVMFERVTAGVPLARLERIQATAMAAAQIACRLVPPDVRREAFTSAVLCDVGLLVLEQGAPQELASARAYADQAKVPLHVAEKNLHGSSHAEIGGYVLGLWGLPPIIVDAVLGHHDLGRDPSPFSAAVHVAHGIVAGEEITPAAAERVGGQARVADLRAEYAKEQQARAHG